MSVRDQVRDLVREELSKRMTLPHRGEHPAFLEIHREPECAEDAPPRPCVIEPERPCYNSGYCKRLGY